MVDGRAVRVGLLGCGNVGGALVELLEREGDTIAERTGVRLEVARVLVRDLAKARAAGTDLLTDDPAAVATAPDVDVVVEVMGAVEPARSLILDALKAGKPVVTANKELIAAVGPELFEAASTAGVDLLFEAAVAGGIPLIRPLRESLAGERLTRVMGIVNGTTNYILTAMADEGRDYDDVLAAAQAAGYAEADPSGDVEGHDAANKLVILARLAFGVWLDPSDIVLSDDAGPGHGRPGISGVTAADVAAAAAAGATIKLVAEARRGPDGRISARVVPVALPAETALARTAGVLNRIEVEAEPVGTVAFSGPGAGGAATSSVVLGALIAIARGAGSTWAGLAPAAAAGAATPGGATPAAATPAGATPGAPAVSGR